VAHDFAAFLDLTDKPCLVIGAGPLAGPKVEALLRARARVTVLAPALDEHLDTARFAWIARDYQPGDLRGYFLAIAARDDTTRNAEIFAEGEAAGVLVNCHDDPKHSRFIFPALHRQGRLTVAISTDGACPALAVRMRNRIAAEAGAEYAEFLEMMAAMRDRIAKLEPDFERRRRLWYALVDSPALALLRDGRSGEARAAIDAILDSVS